MDFRARLTAPPARELFKDYRQVFMNSGNFCNHDWNVTKFVIVFIGKVVAELPGTFQDQIMNLARLKKRVLVQKYDLDYMNTEGFYGMRPDYKEKGLEANTMIVVKFQSGNSVRNVNGWIYPKSSERFTNHPMSFIEIESDGINQVLKNVGGFWSAISGVSFIAFNVFLYRYFFK